MKSLLMTSAFVLFYFGSFMVVDSALFTCCFGGCAHYRIQRRPPITVRRWLTVVTAGRKTTTAATTTTPLTTTTQNAAEADRESAMCVEKQCFGKFGSLIGKMHKHYNQEGVPDMDVAMMNDLCDGQKAIDKCIADKCSVTSAVQDFLNIFGTDDFWCAERAALLNHGTCLLAAVKSGHFTSCVPEGMQTFLQHLHNVHNNGASKSRLRRRRSSRNKESKIAALMAKMRQTTSFFPAAAFTCQNMVAARDCIVERARDECNESDDEENTEASDFAKRAFEEHVERLFAGIKALHPEHVLVDLETCWTNKNDILEGSGSSSSSD